MKRPRPLKWNNKLNGLEHGCLMVSYDSSFILLSIRDWWIPLSRAKQVYKWLGTAIKYAENMDRKTYPSRRKRPT